MWGFFPPMAGRGPSSLKQRRDLSPGTKSHVQERWIIFMVVCLGFWKYDFWSPQPFIRHKSNLNGNK